MGLQIRLTQGTRLGDLAKELITGFETVLRYNRQPIAWGHRQKTKLIRTLRSHLAKAIRAYAPCGDQARCHLTTPISQPKKTERILLLKQSLPILILQLEAATFDRFYPGAADKIWLAMKPELDAVIEDVLRPVLYENPHCGDCALCTPDTRQSPWSGKSAAGGRRR